MSQSSSDEKLRNLAYYREGFSQIKVYSNKKKGGKALNQPILLLAVIDLISQGVINQNCIEITDELIDTFKKYWFVLGSESFKSSDFALPFFHLKNGELKFWRLKYSSEYDGGRPQTIPRLKKDVNYALLDNELFNLLQDTNSRKELIDALIATWFAGSQTELEDVLKINQEFNNSASLELSDLEETEVAEKRPRFYFKKSAIRDAFFRKAVVHIYGYKCAFCGLKVTVSLNQNIVDGAHIKPFAQFYDSRIDNGISFCKNHHWAFDRGLFTIDNNYKIVVSSYFQEDSPNAKPIREFNGNLILLPDFEENFPRLDALKWHRKNVFIN